MALPSSSQLPTLRELSIVAREGKQILRSFLGQNQGLYELDSKADIKRILRENDEERQRAAMESLLTVRSWNILCCGKLYFPNGAAHLIFLLV